MTAAQATALLNQLTPLVDKLNATSRSDIHAYGAIADQIKQAIHPWTRGLQPYIQAKWRDALAGCIAALLPYCRNREEANELAQQTTVVRSLGHKVNMIGCYVTDFPMVLSILAQIADGVAP